MIIHHSDAIMKIDEINRLRREYKSGELQEEDLHSDPFKQFHAWFQDALSADIDMADAMTLATVSAAGIPSARVVALRGYDNRGFVFYTNYRSDKAVDIANNPHVALAFYWKELDRQVRITGIAKKTSRLESETYFSSRPVESNFVQAVSHQSQVVHSKDIIQKRIDTIRKTHQGDTLHCPPHWGGYRVSPTQFEFWQGGLKRLHDRLRYERKNTSWVINRLEP